MPRTYHVSIIMPRPTKEKLHIFKKRDELIRGLDSEGYDGEEIAVMFNLNRSTINRVLNKKQT